MAGGRPTLYTEDTNRLSHEYLESCVDLIVEGKLKVKLPTFEGLSLYLGVSRDTLYEWAKLYPKFSDTLDKLKAKQAEKLMSEGLANNYNSTIAKLILSANHNMREKSDVTSNDEKMEASTIVINSQGKDPDVLVHE